MRFFGLKGRAAMPRAVRVSLILWWLAIGMALVELATPALLASDPAAAFRSRGVELAVRGSVFCLLFVLSLHMAWGWNWARVALTLLFGGLGSLSLIMEPTGWIAAGGDVTGYLSNADAASWVVVAARIAHLLCVLAATGLMYARESRRYFRASNGGGHQVTDT
jgi:hypothetical protein